MKLSWKDCAKIGVSIFALYLCIHFWPKALTAAKAVIGAASPLILGACVAYVVNILMSAYERNWFPDSKNAAVIGSRRGGGMVCCNSQGLKESDTTEQLN